MSEELHISSGSKEERYVELLPQLRAVLSSECDPIANMANMASMLHETFGSRVLWPAPASVGARVSAARPGSAARRSWCPT